MINPIRLKTIEIKNGVVLSSLIDASRSIIFPLFRKKRKRIICAVNPNMNATRIVIVIFSDSVSRLKAKRMKTIIVNEGGTKIVEIILATLSFSIFGKIK